MTNLVISGILRGLVALLLVFPIRLCAEPTKPADIASQILAPLLDPAKVATLKGDRPINTRLYKVLYWLETARRNGGDAYGVIEAAKIATGSCGSPAANADRTSIIWNRQQLEDFGCFTPEGMEKLRKGGSPVITLGPYVGTKIALDHVLPRAVVPEMAARFFNLEAIPTHENLMKSARIGNRELQLARRWNHDGLLSAAGLQAVVAAVE